jgi:glucose/arabinose dehydrogenase
MVAMPLPRRMTAISLMGLLLAACAGPEPSPSADPPPSGTPRASAAPTTAPPSATGAPRATPVPTAVPIADEPPSLGLEVVAEGLADPIGLTATPDGYLLVNEQAGRVIAIHLDSGQTSVALDITDRVGSGGERGLLGLAVHPEWSGANLRAFVHYSDRNGDTVVSEFLVTDFANPPRLDPGTERVLLQVPQPFGNHNGGQLAFGPDGFLWLGLGDGGSGGDPRGNGQNRSVLLGKILRLDVDGDPAGSRAYAIPADNPFVDGVDGAPEVFLVGLRNPWRFSFDRATGQLWIADVGQNALEEVDRVDPAADAGANLGWNLMEASTCYVDGCSAEGLVLPVAEYGRDHGCSVTGGHVYRGGAIDGLGGWYLFSDYCSGLLFGVRSDLPMRGPDERAAMPRVLLETGANVTSFAEDSAGELYLADVGSGTVYRIVAAP